MKTKFSTFLIFAIITFFLLNSSACSTPYQKEGLTGGYSDKYLGDDKWMITIRGNGYTSISTVYEYFYRRAGEIVNENGYKGYEVIDIAVYNSSGYLVTKSKTTIYITKFDKYTLIGIIKCYK